MKRKNLERFETKNEAKFSSLNTKPFSGTGEQLFKNYTDLFFNRNTPNGEDGRKRDMGDLR